jgi:hypothetical protein
MNKNYYIAEPSKLDKFNWKWLLIPLAIILCAAIIIIAAMNSGLVFYIGMVAFFLLGFFAGQSQAWYAVRKMWNHFVNHDDGESE